MMIRKIDMQSFELAEKKILKKKIHHGIDPPNIMRK